MGGRKVSEWERYDAHDNSRNMLWPITPTCAQVSIFNTHGHSSLNLFMVGAGWLVELINIDTELRIDLLIF